MKNKTFWSLISIATIIAVIILVTLNRPDNNPVNKHIKIGSIAALTGTGSAIGEEERNGALLAVEEINKRGGVRGHELELISEDFGFDNFKVGPAIVSKLATVDKVVAIVGAQWDEPTEVILPGIEGYQIPTVGADTTNNVEKDKNYDYFFSTWYDNRTGIRKLLSYVESKGMKRVAIIRPIDNGFWKFTADLVTSYAPEYGIQIIDDVKLNNAFGMDYRTTIAKIKADKPDAVFIVVTDPTQCPFMKQARELGLTVSILGTEASGSYASLNTCGDLMENLYFSTPTHIDRYSAFEVSYLVRFGHKPQYPSTVTAYDAVGIIADALNKTNLATDEVLRDAIASTRGYRGSSVGEITFDSRGYSATPEGAWEVQTVRKGVFVKAE